MTPIISVLKSKLIEKIKLFQTIDCFESIEKNRQYFLSIFYRRTDRIKIELTPKLTKTPVYFLFD